MTEAVVRTRRGPLAWWGRTPLRARLIAIAVALATVAIAVSAVAAHTALKRYLVDRLDQQLVSSARGLVAVEQNREHGSDNGFDPGHDDGPIGGTPFFASHQSADGTLIQGVISQGSAQPKLPKITNAFVQAQGRELFTVKSSTGERWRVTVLPANDGTNFAVGYSLREVDHTLSRLDLIELLVGLITLSLVGVIGWLAVTRSLRPLREVEATAGEIARGDLSRRVPETDPRTEVGRLGVAFNAMLAQIETAFEDRSRSEAAARTSEERMRRFVADASHELRTPLTSIRGFAELYRQGAVTEPEQLRRVMRRVEEEATRMGLLVEDLLMLARLDQERPLERLPVDMLSLAADAVHDARAVDPDRPIALHADEQRAGAPVVVGDEARLRQVLGNLVTNALTHTPPGTAIDVHVATEEADGSPWAVLTVADEGPGLSVDETDKVFERFYRADTSRTRTSGGSGLGLSIVAALVAAHGGAVRVVSRPGQGAAFQVRLPLDRAGIDAPDAEDAAADGAGGTPEEPARTADVDA
jgi:two-component system, OmpR family, sensor kinase